MQQKLMLQATSLRTLAGSDGGCEDSCGVDLREMLAENDGVLMSCSIEVRYG